ncbi:MAG TPA: TPM domain-containing protein [Ferruginibacter sp.]|nr:TPM domain-containing protein [Ferruginibacter sp.]
MKKRSFVLVFFLNFILLSCNTAKETIWVLDGEQVLTPEQIIKLDSLYKAHERKTTNEIALITTKDYGNDASLLSFAVNTGRKYGVGKKDINNGVLIVFSNTKHETMISTGYGTEKVLKDGIAKKIIDSLMIPAFKDGRIFDGLWQGSKAIIDFLEKPGNEIR